MKKYQMLKVLYFSVSSEDEKKGIYLIPDFWSQKNATMQVNIFASTYFAQRLSSNIYHNISNSGIDQPVYSFIPVRFSI